RAKSHRDRRRTPARQELDFGRANGTIRAPSPFPASSLETGPSPQPRFRPPSRRVEDMANTTRQKAPRLIGDYVVIERIATSDLATVYKGRDPATGEVVAIKVATPAIAANPVLVKRFTQEFAMIKGLKHPHLIRALRFGHHADAPYMALEFVDG